MVSKKNQKKRKDNTIEYIGVEQKNIIIVFLRSVSQGPLQGGNILIRPNSHRGSHHPGKIQF